MPKVSGSKPDGVQDKKRKQGARILGNMEEKKRGKKGDREVENRGKDSVRERAIKSSFIHMVSSNYQCIYSIA